MKISVKTALLGAVAAVAMFATALPADAAQGDRASKTGQAAQAPQASQAQQQASAQDVSSKPAGEIIRNWPDASQKAAKQMIQKYGQPQVRSNEMLVWLDNGPWKQTTVYNQPEDHNFPMPHKDVLEQTINYEVPENKFNELASFDGSVIAKRTFGELGVRCDSEKGNFVALNLANDVVTGALDVDGARQQYAQIMQQVMNGETPPYAQGFQFEVASQDLNFPGESIMSQVRTGQR